MHLGIIHGGKPSGFIKQGANYGFMYMPEHLLMCNYSLALPAPHIGCFFLGARRSPLSDPDLRCFDAAELQSVNNSRHL